MISLGLQELTRGDQRGLSVTKVLHAKVLQHLRLCMFLTQISDRPLSVEGTRSDDVVHGCKPTRLGANAHANAQAHD